MTESSVTPGAGYLRLPQVLEIIPVSRSSWYRGIQSGIYPRPVKLGIRSSGWKIEAIQNCMAELENASSLSISKSVTTTRFPD